MRAPFLKIPVPLAPTNPGMSFAVSHRHRAQARLERHVPSVRERVERAPWARLVARADEPEQAERRVLGESLRVRGADDVRTKRVKVEEPGPNAPLLMRIVRHPFELEPVRYGKVRHRDEVGERQRVEPRDPALAYREELRADYQRQNPFIVYAHRPAVRPPPFLKARLAAEALDE